MHVWSSRAAGGPVWWGRTHHKPVRGGPEEDFKAQAQHLLFVPCDGARDRSPQWLVAGVARPPTSSCTMAVVRRRRWARTPVLFSSESVSLGSWEVDQCKRTIQVEDVGAMPRACESRHSAPGARLVLLGEMSGSIDSNGGVEFHYGHADPSSRSVLLGARPPPTTPTRSSQAPSDKDGNMKFRPGLGNISKLHCWTSCQTVPRHP